MARKWGLAYESICSRESLTDMRILYCCPESFDDCLDAYDSILVLTGELRYGPWIMSILKAFIWNDQRSKNNNPQNRL